jgi:hypothetical protein
MACTALIGLMSTCNLIYNEWLRHIIDSVASWSNAGAACDVNNIKACENAFIYFTAAQTYGYATFMLITCGILGHIIARVLLHTRTAKSKVAITGGLVLAAMMSPFIITDLVSALSGALHFLLLYLVFLSTLLPFAKKHNN